MKLIAVIVLFTVIPTSFEFQPISKKLRDWRFLQHNFIDSITKDVSIESSMETSESYEHASDRLSTPNISFNTGGLFGLLGYLKILFFLKKQCPSSCTSTSTSSTTTTSTAKSTTITTSMPGTTFFATGTITSSTTSVLTLTTTNILMETTTLFVTSTSSNAITTSQFVTSTSTQIFVTSTTVTTNVFRFGTFGGTSAIPGDGNHLVDVGDEDFSYGDNFIGLFR
jgi:hypothetical protein